jgi:hypothetical protein
MPQSRPSHSPHCGGRGQHRLAIEPDIAVIQIRAPRQLARAAEPHPLGRSAVLETPAVRIVRIQNRVIGFHLMIQNMALGVRVPIHRVMPVEMVLGDIQDHRDVGPE